MRRKFARHSGPVLVMVLALLLMAVPDVQPSVAETSSAIDQTHSLGYIEIVDGGTQFLPIGAEVKTGPQANPDQDVYQAVLTSADFVSAEAHTDDEGRPVIEFTLTPEGDARLAAFTSKLPTYYLCLAVDGQVVNCPILRTPLVNRRGTIELTGDATLDDARTLAMSLRFGPD